MTRNILGKVSSIPFLVTALMASCLSSSGFALPASMMCRVFMPVPFNQLKFEQPLDGQTTEVNYISPAQKEYRLRATYNKSVSNLNINIEVPKLGGFASIFHAIAPVVEIAGRINEIHVHLFGEILDGEALVVECPPANE
jgi:hypothetical protein